MDDADDFDELLRTVEARKRVVKPEGVTKQYEKRRRSKRKALRAQLPEMEDASLVDDAQSVSVGSSEPSRDKRRHRYFCLLVSGTIIASCGLFGAVLQAWRAPSFPPPFLPPSWPPVSPFPSEPPNPPPPPCQPPASPPNLPPLPPPSPQPPRSPPMPPEDLPSMRVRLARLSLSMLPGQTAVVSSRSRSPLVDIRNVCAVFESAYQAGGAMNALALLERQPFLEATQRALRTSGRDAHVASVSSIDTGCGIEYSKTDSGGAEDLLGQPLRDGGKLWGPADIENKQKKCWTHGSLWWLRHWVGAWLAEKRAEEEAAETTRTDGGSTRVSELITWLQTQATEGQLHGDFLWIASLHGALFQLIGPTGFRAEESGAPLAYPSELAQRLCHDSVANVYECRHGIGHGVLYAVLMRHAHQLGLANFTACAQPRPYAVQVTIQMFDEVWAICRQAEALSTQDQVSYAQGCVSGATHSGYLFDTRFAAYGQS